MDSGDIQRQDLTLVRRAMTADSKEERMNILEGREEAQKYFLEKWNGRQVCGQCNSYTQLGGRGSGYAGVCQKLVTTEYLSPEDMGCEKFAKRGNIDK